MEEEFSSVLELKKRLTPALISKKEELKRVSITNISEEDIWLYLSKNKWAKANNLTLYDMVSDILHLDNTIIKATKQTGKEV